MTAVKIGSLSDDADLLLEDVESSGQFLLGIDITDDSVLEMHRCSINSVAVALVSTSSIDVELVVHQPTIRAYDTDAFVTDAPAVQFGGLREVFSAGKVAGMAVAGDSAQVTDVEIAGICDAYGMWLSGTNNFINGVLIQCDAAVGLLVDANSPCGRASQVKVHGATDFSTLTEASVRVAGDNTYPEVQLDGVEVCGPGVSSLVTYSCNVEPNDCSGDPCDSCDPLQCDENSPLGDMVTSSCSDPDCWPPEDQRDQAQFSFCTFNAILWDLTAPIKCTRAVPLTFQDQTAGTMSNMWRPLSFDCLVEAELNVWTDDYPGATGNTEVILYNDESGDTVTLTCPSTDALVTELVGWEIYPRTPFYNQTQIRAEIVSVTTPVTNVWIGVTLRFP